MDKTLFARPEDKSRESFLLGWAALIVGLTVAFGPGGISIGIGLGLMWIGATSK